MKNLISFLIFAMLIGCGDDGTGGQVFSADPPLVIGGDERPAEIDAALWTINDGGHIPGFSTEFADMTTDWLFGHSR